jgi:hypothetical protein
MKAAAGGFVPQCGLRLNLPRNETPAAALSWASEIRAIEE